MNKMNVNPTRALFSLICAASVATAATPLNWILIFSDDQSYDDVNTYACAAELKTPDIDQIETPMKLIPARQLLMQNLKLTEAEYGEKREAFCRSYRANSKKRDVNNDGALNIPTN